MEHYLENNTAILVFANSPEEELIHKPVVHGVKLFNALTDRTLQTVRATGIPYFHYSEKEQTGDTFGERLINAIGSVFEKGYSRVITLGNDSPQIKVSDILRARDLLTQEQFVLGPTADGGCYLLGLQRSHFHLLDLKSLPWQCTDLADAIIGRAERQGLPIAKLHTLYDLDTLYDIRLMGARFRNIGKRLWSLIQYLLEGEKGQFQPVFVSPNASSRANLFNKGSPGL